MIYLFKMALRNLERNRRRSFFSALALALGLALLLLIAGILNGELTSSLENAIRLESGHLQIRAASYNADKTSLAWSDLIASPAAIAAQTAAIPQVQTATPRLFASGILQSGDNSMGVRILGVDTASSANAPIREGMLSGQFLAENDAQGILVGKTLADKLGMKAGAQVNLLVNTSSGGVDQQAFTVRGVYSTGIPGYDQATVFMPLAKAQSITGAGDRASAIFVLLKDRNQADAVAASLTSPQYQVKTWTQMNELLVQTEQLMTGYIFLLYLVVLAVTATVIINTLIMSVFERTREIGILAAMGMKGWRIMTMFLAESFLLAVGGAVIGLGLGLLLDAYFSRFGLHIGNMGVTGISLGETLYSRLTFNDAAGLTIAAFAITLLAALYPALIAARMEPVTALRGGK